MTDTHQPAPKKSTRPNLFGPPEATRIIDERISVLASLDANPPPKKRKKRGLARSTQVMLGITGVLFVGVIYLALTQSSFQSQTEASDAAVTAAPATAPVAVVHAQPTSPNNAADDAPSLSLRELAASTPVAEASTPASAVIENVALAPHNPVAILESGSSSQVATASSSKTKASKPAATQSAPSGPLKALGTAEPASKSAKPSTRTASTTAKPAASARSSAAKAAPIDADVVLLEGLLASSNRQEAKERAAATNKTKEPGKTSETGKSAEKTE